MRSRTRRTCARIAALAMVAVGLGAVAAAPVAAVPAGARAEDGIVVKLKAGSTASSVAKAHGGSIGSELSHGRAHVKLGKSASLAEKLAAVERDPRVEWAEPNMRYRAAVTPSDPCLTSCFGDNKQWAPAVVRAFEAWNTSKGSSSIRVAVLDGGVDASHAQLQGKVVTGADFTDTDQDGCWDHGTHVAGTIAARTNDNSGVAGLGWNTEVLAVRVLSYDVEEDDCTGFLVDIAKGIDYAVASGASVVNLSLAGTFDSKAIRDSVTSAIAKNVVVVAAAGNEGQDGNPVEYPAALGDVLSVGATTSTDQTADYSNRGGWVDIAAPGSGILSLLPGGAYGIMSGTSMATPHVSAAVALLRAAAPGLTAREVLARVQMGSDAFAGAGTDVRYGRLNMAKALTDNGKPGYYMVATDGGIFSFGRSPFYGSTGGITLLRPIVGMTTRPRRTGYWFVASDGGIFNYGDAGFHGSLGGQTLPSPIAGMAALADGSGYFLYGVHGPVTAFGAAKATAAATSFSTPQHVVAGAVNPTGAGLWLSSAEGSVFTFGDALNLGSMAGMPLNKPMVGMAVTPSGRGYWLVASDGGIFAYGDAKFYGSTGGIALNQPIVGMQSTLTGQGYWLVASDGGIFAFGDAEFAGSMGGIPLNKPVVGIG